MNRIADKKAKKEFVYHSIYCTYYNILLYAESNNSSRIK